MQWQPQKHDDEDQHDLRGKTFSISVFLTGGEYIFSHNLRNVRQLNGVTDRDEAQRLSLQRLREHLDLMTKELDAAILEAVPDQLTERN